MAPEKPCKRLSREAPPTSTDNVAAEYGPTPDVRGFTLIELLVVVALIGILTLIAMSGFEKAKTIARTSRCSAEIRTLEKSISNFYTDKGYLPDSLAQVNQADLHDPWGNQYVYAKIEGNPLAVPLENGVATQYNYEFDLYSKGPDGSSLITYDPLTPSASDDDIIRGGDGSFVGARWRYDTP